MIIKIIKSKMINLFLANRALLLLNFCIICYVSGSARSTAISYGLGLFDYALLVLADHYYVLYCLLPIMIVVITKHIRNLNDVEKIRYRSITQMMQVEIISFTSWFGLYLLASLIIVLLIGLPTFKPNLYAGDFRPNSHNEILLLLGEYKAFSRLPIISILAALLYYCFGFTTLTALLSLVNNKKGPRETISVAVIVLVLTFIGFHTALSNELPLLFLSNYIILHRGLFLNGLPAFLLTFLAGLGIILFALGYRFPKLKTTSILNELTVSRKMKRITILFIIFLFLIEYFQMRYEGDFNVRDIAIRLVLGTNLEFRSFIGWIKISLIYLLPIFFVGISISKIKQYKELPIFMRFESFGRLRWKILIEYATFLLQYAGFLGIFLIAMFLIGSDSSPLSLALKEAIGINLATRHFIGYTLVLILTMMFNLVLFLILSKLTNETAAFVGIVLLSFVNFLVPGIKLLEINPGILMFFENLQQGETNLYFKVVVLALITVIFFGLAKRRMYANNQTY